MGVFNTLLTFAALGTAAYIVMYYLIPQIKANPDLIPSLFPPLLPPAAAQQQQPAAPLPQTQTPADDLAGQTLLDEPEPPPAVDDEPTAEGITADDASILDDLAETLGVVPEDEEEEEDDDKDDDDDDDDEDEGKKDSMGISEKKLKEQDKKSKKQQERHEKTLKESDPKKDSRYKGMSSKDAGRAAAKALGLYTNIKNNSYYATRFYPLTSYY